MSDHSGVGMPAALWLDQFGSYVWDAFDATPYLVGSVLRAMRGEAVGWRDVDVRLILDDERYAAEGYGEPRDAHRNAKWVATCLAWSAFGHRLTGLPIDFQVQQRTDANNNPVNEGSRSALGLIPSRFVDSVAASRAPQEEPNEAGRSPRGSP